MAERRMFAKTIIDSDAFIDMPLSTQALYFHLSMRADDDGFINNPKKIQRMIGSSDDDLKLLILKRFIIPFDSGIVVIKHWKIHNYIRNDRYKPTVYTSEKAMITSKENGAYTEVDTVGIPNGYQMDTQYSIGKDSTELGKDSGEDNPPSPPVVPTSDTVEFEELWSKYPRKEGKKAAFASYQRAKKKGTTFDDVHTGILNYLDYIKAKKISTQYIKQGSTWFNGEHWNDEYDYSFVESTSTQQASSNPFLDMLKEGM